MQEAQKKKTEAACFYAGFRLETIAVKEKRCRPSGGRIVLKKPNVFKKTVLYVYVSLLLTGSLCYNEFDYNDTIGCIGTVSIQSIWLDMQIAFETYCIF